LARKPPTSEKKGVGQEGKLFGVSKKGGMGRPRKKGKQRRGETLDTITKEN